MSQMSQIRSLYRVFSDVPQLSTFRSYVSLSFGSDKSIILILARLRSRFEIRLGTTLTSHLSLFFGDKKRDALDLSHFWEECDALAYENMFFNL